jgi:YidC/Oxa1 family membrane protein insertase
MHLPPIAIIPQPFLTVLEDVLTFWHDLVGGSWGWAIILLTFTIRILILPLTFKGVKSMQKLQVLQPEMKKIQARYKDDKQRMNQEMMKFYQENKVNPLGSCLPLLLQIPFFIALFELLRSDSFQADIAGNAAFGPINDLAEPLTGQPVVLGFMIVLYVATQLIATMITSIGGDKTQQRIMMALPFVFVVFIINFEAGLIVYWITTNVWTIGQQLVVRKLYPRPDLEDSATTVPAGAVALAGKSDGKQSGAKSDASGNGSAKAPPPSPRKKKKRSGRRR